MILHKSFFPLSFFYFAVWSGGTFTPQHELFQDGILPRTPGKRQCYVRICFFRRLETRLCYKFLLDTPVSLI